MTHYTEEEAVALAREFYHDAFEWDGIGQGWIRWYMFTKLLNAAVARKLAVKELEVLKLREALYLIEPTMKFSGWENRHGEEIGEKIDKLISTPPSTKALDEYVAARMAESEAKTCKWTPWTDTGAIYDTECGGAWTFESGDIDDNGVNFCPFCGGKIDAAIEAEKVRTE